MVTGIRQLAVQGGVVMKEAVSAAEGPASPDVGQGSKYLPGNAGGARNIEVVSEALRLKGLMEQSIVARQPDDDHDKNDSRSVDLKCCSRIVCEEYQENYREDKPKVINCLCYIDPHRDPYGPCDDDDDKFHGERLRF